MPPSAEDMVQRQTSSIHRAAGVEHVQSTATGTATPTHAGTAPMMMPNLKSRFSATAGYSLSSSPLPGSPLPKQSNDGMWIAGASPEARLGLKHMRAYEESPASSKVRAFVYELND